MFFSSSLKPGIVAKYDGFQYGGNKLLKQLVILRLHYDQIIIFGDATFRWIKILSNIILRKHESYFFSDRKGVDGY